LGVTARSEKVRLDALLFRKGFVESRSHAQALILSGQVEVNGQVVSKAGHLVAGEVKLHVRTAMPFVSRGGEKLKGAFLNFGITVQDRVCLDIGASTGGFTDCLLSFGASRVYAVDVGRHQLHERLRKNPRVFSIESTHVRHLPIMAPRQFIPPPDFCCIDVSFISLEKVLPIIDQVIKKPAEVLALVKPQFEVGPKKAPKGVVRDVQIKRQTVEKIKEFMRSLHWKIMGDCSSSLKGPKGNQEFFIYAVV